eukprot:scaffold353_cov185-Amphora_coffeaeformis.AAC.35
MVYGCGELFLLSDEPEMASVASKKSKAKPPQISAAASFGGNLNLEVVCPFGVSEGNTIIVVSPFGTRRHAVACPKRIRPGDTFVVKMPSVNEKPSEPRLGDFMLALDNFLTPTPEVVGTPV